MFSPIIFIKIHIKIPTLKVPEIYYLFNNEQVKWVKTKAMRN